MREVGKVLERQALSPDVGGQAAVRDGGLDGSLVKIGQGGGQTVDQSFSPQQEGPPQAAEEKASSWTSPAGLSLRTHRSTADVTLGAGRNFSRGTSKRYSVSI